MKQLQILATSAILLSNTALTSAQQPQLNWDEVHYTGSGTNTGKRVLLGEADAVYVLGEDGVDAAYLARYRSYDGQPQWLVQWDSATAAVDLVRSADGTLIAAWEFYNEPFNSPLDIGVGAWSSDGDPLWTFYWNDSLDRDDIVRDLHVDPDGNILLCATTEELSGNPSVFNNISVLKLDPAGNLLWRHTWNGTLNNNDEPNAITCDADGNIYVTGYTTNGGINGQDLLLLKYNADGVLQWDESINRNSTFGSHVDIGTRVLVHADGSIIVGGVTESPGSDNGQDLSLYAFNSAGDIQWPYHYSYQNEEALLDLEAGPDGDLYLLGRYSANDGNGEVVVRVNNGGTMQWASTFATTGLDARFPSALALSPDGNVITTGMVGDQLLRDAYARSYDPDGEALWTFRYTAVNSFNEEEGHDVAVGANSAIYVTGMYNQSGQSLIRGLTFCLCPTAEGVCLLAPELRPASPTSAMAGLDLDQDGWRDLVFSTPLANALGVYMGGTDGFTLTFPVVVPAEPSLLTTGDLDSDGDVDVVAGNFGGPDLHLLLNTAGTLATTSTLSIAQGVLDAQVADLDGINGPDIVAVMNAEPYLVVYLNDGGASFSATYPTPVPNPYRVAIGDANTDGIADLVIGRAVQDSIYVLYGNGTGVFSAPDGFESGIFTAPAAVGIGDFNFDGINDLVTCNGSNSWGMRAGLGGGDYEPAVSGIAGPVDRFIIAPFAEDSTWNMVTGSYGSTGQVRFSPCSQTYNNVALASTAPGNHLIDVADWTNDGSPDLLSYHTQGEIRLWRNCDTLGVITRTPMNDIIELDALMVYPVPASDAVTLVRPAGAIGPAEIRVATTRGETVNRFTGSSAQEVMQLGDLAGGDYVLQYRTANGIWTARITVVRP